MWRTALSVLYTCQVELKKKSCEESRFAQSADLLHDVLIRFSCFLATRSCNMKEFFDILPKDVEDDYDILVKLVMLKRDY